MNFSHSEENYIKNIYHLQDESGEVAASSLAALMQTKAASVTEMLKKLHGKKIINYQPYKSFSLTESGLKTALEVIRKHRLWEYFLVNKLGFNWDAVHEIAEELEHVSSTELISRLDSFLGNPMFDPHGDPIPDSKGKIKMVKHVALSELPLKIPAKVSSIKDQSASMLQMLKHYNIHIGSNIKVMRKFEFDSSIEIKIEKGPVSIISGQLSKNIYCIV
ncbi:MAG: metal-dependent transcriptional regulator [Ferruginibacter sp.]